MAIRTIERRIGIVGPRWSGKTVLLTSLINHLKFHEPSRFKIGKVDKPAEINQFKELRDIKEATRKDALPWFDYEGYRNQLVRNGQWPAATKDTSQYICEFERSDWRFSNLRLHFQDLPGERVNDIPMMTAEKDQTQKYIKWADRICHRLEKDLHLQEQFQPFFARCRDQATSFEQAVHEYKRALAAMRLAYRPYITPSTFLLDREGKRIKGTNPDELASTRYCGLDLASEFIPIPADVRSARPDWVTTVVPRFTSYCNEVLFPVVAGLKSCHGLVIMVDVLAILAHGPAMYEDYRQLVADLLAGLNPSDTTFDLVMRNFYENLLPISLRRTWINRIAFVAPKMDRVPFEDRSKVKSLMEQLVRHEAKNCRGIKIEYFPVGAVVGAKPNSNNPREMIGCTLYDANGVPLKPGVELKFTPSEVPDQWPEAGWKAGDFIFPDVYPKVSPLANCPTDQLGLDDLFNFFCW